MDCNNKFWNGKPVNRQNKRFLGASQWLKHYTHRAYCICLDIKLPGANLPVPYPSTAVTNGSLNVIHNLTYKNKITVITVRTYDNKQIKLLQYKGLVIQIM